MENVVEDTPEVVEILRKNDFDHRRIYLFGEIDEPEAHVIISQLNYFSDKSQEPIYILIHSPGGSVTSAEAIIDQMQMCQEEGIKIYTIAMGECCSAAAVILAMGSKGCRLVRPKSVVMLHPTSYGFESDYQEYQNRATKFLQERSSEINDYLCDAVGVKDKEKKKFLTEINKSIWLDAENAVKKGIADRIYAGRIDEKSISK